MASSRRGLVAPKNRDDQQSDELRAYDDADRIVGFLTALND
jgi:hypothetical protein